jgi:HECT-domain (ubiquitin-transferase)
MQFFDKPRPKIALRGSSRNAQSSTELLAAARAQREARARARAEYTAASSIQAAVRARTAHAAVVRRITTAARPEALVLAATRAVPGSTDAAAFGPTIGTSADPLLFGALERYIDARTATRDSLDEANLLGGSALAAAKAAVVAVAFAARAKEVVMSVRQRESCLQVAAAALRACANCGEAVREVVTCVVIKWRLFALVAELLELQSSQASADLTGLSELVDAVLVPERRDAVSVSLWHAFAADVLTVHGAAERLHVSSGPHGALFVTVLLESMANVNDDMETFYVDTKDLEPAQNDSAADGANQRSPDDYHIWIRTPADVAALLSNVLFLGRDVWVSPSSERLWALISVVATLVRDMPESTLGGGELDDDDDDTGIDAPISNGGGDVDVHATDSSVVDSLMASLSSIASDETVRSLFSAAIADGRLTTVRVCKLFIVLTRREQRLRMSFQSALAFWRPAAAAPGSASAVLSDHILPRLWELCRDQNTGVDLADDMAPVLLVFVRAYSHFLYVQDEEEMFEQQRPFTIEKVRDIVQTLKRVLFSTLYVRASSTAPGCMSAATIRGEPDLLDEIARLMSRLYIVDSRRQFRIVDDFWIVGGGALSSNTFVLDAVEAGSDALSTPAIAGDLPASMHSYTGVAPKYRGRKAAISGAGELLRMAPYLAPFSSRAKVFHTWVAAEREKYAGPAALGGINGRWITVRRNYLFEDAYDQLQGPRAEWENLKKSIRVKFIDEHGIEEAGIDGGGVYKEFMYEALRRAFSPSLYGLFCETPDGHLYPNPSAHLVDDLFEQRFEFVGRLLAKALFDGVLVDIPLASFFLSKMMLKFNYPSDLRSLDPELYKNLMFLRKCDADVVESLGLNFVVANNSFGEMSEVELVRGGHDIPVTAGNRIEYIHRVSNYRMNVQMRRQCDAFVRGFSSVIRPEYIRLFSERELQLLISGSTNSLDVPDLRRNTKYSGGYTEDSDVIRWFWQALSELDAEDQSKLLQFVTSSPRAPLLGFSYLNPSFCVHRAEGEGRLPTASTCMNLLKLPHYKDLDTLRSKLRYSLEANSGFDLS